MRLSGAATALVDRPARLAMSARIKRLLHILLLVRPHLNGADLRRRYYRRGNHRTNGWPNGHDLDVERHITAGSGGHAEVLRKRHGERGRTIMGVTEHRDCTGRNRSGPPPPGETSTRKRRP